MDAVFTRARGASNLDRYFFNNHFAAVFDGCTPKADDEVRARAATAALVDRLTAVLARTPPELEQADLLRRLSAAARHDGDHQPSASGAVFSRHLGLVLTVGDVWVGVDGVNQRFGHELEHVHATLRAAHISLALARGASLEEVRRDDPGRRAIEPLLRQESQFRNIDAPGDYFFAALDGRPVPSRLIRTVEVPDDASHLVLATDGYPALGSSLEETEALLAARVRTDPLLINEDPMTKAVPLGSDGYDDRTYLAMRLGPGV